MEDECYEEELELCEEHSFDTFGGHTKALHGFKTYNIEGAELYNMGQVESIFCELPLPAADSARLRDVVVVGRREPEGRI